MSCLPAERSLLVVKPPNTSLHWTLRHKSRKRTSRQARASKFNRSAANEIMKKYQERCDRCGRWVADCGLVWSDDTYTEAICDNCLRIQQAAEHTLAHGQGEEYCVCEKPIAEKGFCFVCQSPVRPASKA